MKSKPATAPAAPKQKAAPARAAHLTAAVKKNMPANWEGTDKQYIELYEHNLAGFQQQAEKAFAQLFPDMARVAMMKKKDMETPAVEMIAKIKVDFTDLDVAQFNGGLTFKEERKHDASMGFVEDLNPKAKGRQTDMITNPPTAGSPTLTVVQGGKSETVKPNAPQNKAAAQSTNKAGAKPATKRAAAAPKSPAKPEEAAQPKEGNAAAQPAAAEG